MRTFPLVFTDRGFKEDPGKPDSPAAGGSLVEQDVETLRGLPRGLYCDLVESLSETCAVSSILDLWEFDEAVIRNLTREDIIRDINTVKRRLKQEEKGLIDLRRLGFNCLIYPG